MAEPESESRVVQLKRKKYFRPYDEKRTESWGLAFLADVASAVFTPVLYLTLPAVIISVIIRLFAS